MRDTDRELLKELVRLDVSQTDCAETRRVLETCPDVADTLANPLVTHDEKRGIISKLFPESVQKFMINTVRSGAVAHIGEILDEYEDMLLDKQGSIKAVVRS